MSLVIRESGAPPESWEGLARQHGLFYHHPLWVANRMLRGDTDECIVEQGEELAAALALGPADLTLVSNEVGAGVHPATGEGRRFRDLLGTVNQRVAAAADRVVLMVAGLPLAMKSSA